MQSPGWQPTISVAWCLIWWFASSEKVWWHMTPYILLRPGVIKHPPPTPTIFSPLGFCYGYIHAENVPCPKLEYIYFYMYHPLSTNQIFAPKIAHTICIEICSEPAHQYAKSISLWACTFTHFISIHHKPYLCSCVSKTSPIPICVWWVSIPQGFVYAFLYT